MFNSIKNYESLLYKKLKSKFDSLNDKNKTIFNMLGRTLIYMTIITYLSGFIQYRSDYVWFIVIVVVLGIVVFFVKR